MLRQTSSVEEVMRQHGWSVGARRLHSNAGCITAPPPQLAATNRLRFPSHASFRRELLLRPFIKLPAGPRMGEPSFPDLEDCQGQADLQLSLPSPLGPELHRLCRPGKAFGISVLEIHVFVVRLPCPGLWRLDHRLSYMPVVHCCVCKRLRSSRREAW